MDGINDYLNRKAQKLGLERQGHLSQIQAHLDEVLPGMCRAVSLQDGVLTIATSSASVASELRLRQIGLLKTLRGAVAIQKLRIEIRS